MNIYNNIILRKKQSLFIQDKKNVNIVLQHDIQNILNKLSYYGYTLDQDICKLLLTYNQHDLESFKLDLIDEIADITGMDTGHSPLIKNFNKSDYEAYIKTVYSENGNELPCGCKIDLKKEIVDKYHFCPICNEEFSEPISEMELDFSNLKIITHAKADDIYALFTDIVGSNIPLSKYNKEIVKTIIEIEKDKIYSYFPKKTTVRETISFISTVIINKKIEPSYIYQNITTITDVLRLAASLCDGDVTLKKQTYRYDFNNSTKKIIINLIDIISAKNTNSLQDAVKYRKNWLHLLKSLHVGSYEKKYNSAFKFAKTLREDHKSINTFASTVDEYYWKSGLVSKNISNNGVVASDRKSVSEKYMDNLLKLLRTRPGEFVRRLDFLLRSPIDNIAVVDEFAVVITKIESRMLLQLVSHFKARSIPSKIRYFIPKGEISNIKVINEDKRIPISKPVGNYLIKTIEKELIRRFKTKEKLGSVYISDSLKNFTFPMNNRMSTKSIVNIPMGSVIPIEESDYFRLFIYWENKKTETGNDRTDIDLSVICYDENYQYKEHISFNNMRSRHGANIRHSGDITDAPNGASEYIDFDIASLKTAGFKYLVMNVISFSGITFDEIKCNAGYMKLSEFTKEKNIYYNPKDIENKFDVSGRYLVNIPLVIDVDTLMIYWANISLSGISDMGRCVEHGKSGISAMIEALEQMNKENMNLYDFFMYHLKARAENVDLIPSNTKKYDLVLDNEILKDLDNILANWL
jgi:hypothetical protein